MNKYLEDRLRELEEQRDELDRNLPTTDARAREAAITALVATKEKIEGVKRQIAERKEERVDPDLAAYRKEQLPAAKAEVERLKAAIEKAKQ